MHIVWWHCSVIICNCSYIYYCLCNYATSHVHAWPLSYSLSQQQTIIHPGVTYLYTGKRTYMHTNIHTTYTHTYSHTYTHTTCIHTYIHTNIPIHIHTHIHTCIHLHKHTCIQTYKQPYTHKYIHTFIKPHTHIHTYMRTYYTQTNMPIQTYNIHTHGENNGGIKGGGLLGDTPPSPSMAALMKHVMRQSGLWLPVLYPHIWQYIYNRVCMYTSVSLSGGVCPCLHVGVPVCLFAWLCMHLSLCICIYMCMYVCFCLYAICISVSMFVCMFVWLYGCMIVGMYDWMSVCFMYIWICIFVYYMCMFVCLCICISARGSVRPFACHTA